MVACTGDVRGWNGTIAREKGECERERKRVERGFVKARTRSTEDPREGNGKGEKDRTRESDGVVRLQRERRNGDSARVRVTENLRE